MTRPSELKCVPLNKNFWAFVASVLGISILMSCASINSNDEPVDSEIRSGQNQLSNIDSNLSISTLPAQTLRSGQCGLFLFTPFPSPRFVFFAESSSRIGKVVINGQEHALQLTSSTGTLMDQHYTSSVFTSSDQTNVEVTIDDFERSNIGIRIETGLINVKSPDGWSLTIPVSGTTTCYNEDS